jgi:hypothetical protein
MKISIISTISIFIICCCNVNNSEAESFAAIPLNEPFVIVLDDKSVGLWKEDLNYLIRMIKQTHPNPFFSGNEDEFNQMSQWIDANIQYMNRDQLILSFMRLVALVGVNGNDGHTGLWPYREPVGFHLYPLRLYLFEDGLYIVDAEPNKELIGARVDSINGHTTEKLLKLIDPFISRDGPMWVKSWAPIHLISREFQQVLGFSGKNGRSDFALTKNGKSFSVELNSITHTDYHDHFPMYLWQGILPFSDSPSYLNPKDAYYWYEELTENRSLYFQYNAITTENKEGIKLDTFITEFVKKIDSGTIDRLIIDLRLNGGGDNTVYKNLLNFLIENPFFKEEGRLFVLIGRATFSAGINFVTDVELKTNAILMGEATGGSPNQYGDAKGVVLPNSGVKFRVSTQYWNKAGTNDHRQEHKPHLSLPLLSSDYFSGKDRLIKMVLDYSEKSSIKKESKSH